VYAGDADIKPLIEKAIRARNDARLKREPFEVSPGLFEFSNEYDQALDHLQDQINEIIKKTEIFKSAGSRVYSTVGGEDGAGESD